MRTFKNVLALSLHLKRSPLTKFPGTEYLIAIFSVQWKRIKQVHHTLCSFCILPIKKQIYPTTKPKYPIYLINPFTQLFPKESSFTMFTTETCEHHIFTPVVKEEAGWNLSHFPLTSWSDMQKIRYQTLQRNSKSRKVG